jgi:ketosteroid isomerase-like protein
LNPPALEPVNLVLEDFQPMSAQESTLQLKNAFQDFVGLLLPLSEQAFRSPQDGGWSPGDVAAHLAGWNRLMIAAARSILSGQPPAYYADQPNDYRTINAGFTAQYASRSKAELLAELEASLADLQAFVQALPHQALLADHGVRHYRGSPATLSKLLASLAGDYQVHTQEIRAWLKKGSETMEATILSLEQAAMERWRNGDPWGFVEISADDLSYVDPGLAQPLLGIEKYRLYMKGIEGQVHYQRSEFIDPQVLLVGEAAVLSYNYRSSVLSSAGQVVNQTNWNSTEVYFHRNDRWQIVHTHWSFLKHTLPASLEVPLPVELQPQPYAGVLGELMALESAAMQRWRNGDPFGFIELYAPQVTYFDTATPQRLNGLAALRSELGGRQGKIHYDVMEFIQPRLHLQGDLAVLFYRFFSTRLNLDGSIAGRTPWNCTEVYARLDGQWRIIHNHWSFIQGQLAR